MSELEITEEGELLENYTLHPFIKALGVFFSWLFHPLLLIVWVSWYLLYVNDLIFLGMDSFDRLKVFLRILSTSVFLPLITVLLLKGLGFIKSIQLRTQKERIIPYVACITFFFWSYYVSKQLDDPGELRAFLLTLFITASAALIINNYMKISMHALGAGSLFCFFMLLLFHGRIEESLPLLAVVFVSGIICSSRLIASDHYPFEVGFGFVMGFLIQLVCWFIAT
ncbi:MAG: hypothetical protein K2X48_14090 [Chitinophagaceae bacterium]|nr:hypothetical protein [Chitinophagaceae bacterium]